MTYQEFLDEMDKLRREIARLNDVITRLVAENESLKMARVNEVAPEKKARKNVRNV